MKRLLCWPFLLAYSWFIRWTIWEAEDHLRECAADGLIQSLSLGEFRAQIDRDRVRLAAVYAQMQPARRATTSRAKA